jgi:hypothetical protein
MANGQGMKATGLQQLQQKQGFSGGTQGPYGHLHSAFQESLETLNASYTSLASQSASQIQTLTSQNALLSTQVQDLESKLSSVSNSLTDKSMQLDQALRLNQKLSQEKSLLANQLNGLKKSLLHLEAFKRSIVNMVQVDNKGTTAGGAELGGLEEANDPMNSFVMGGPLVGGVGHSFNLDSLSFSAHPTGGQGHVKDTGALLLPEGFSYYGLPSTSSSKQVFKLESDILRESDSQRDPTALYKSIRALVTSEQFDQFADWIQEFNSGLVSPEETLQRVNGLLLEHQDLVKEFEGLVLDAVNSEDDLDDDNEGEGHDS